MKLSLGSLFDGSGGFPLAGSLCGIEPKWASEVEPYPIAVTKSRFPNMKHLGDISKINGAEIEPVDIITFGSPCQDLSVAGKRAGLKHEDKGDEETTRSGLFMEAVRIIKEMRGATNGVYPRFALWENVPGAFSSNKGEDFRIVLEELIKIVEPTAVMPDVPKAGWSYADSYCGDGWSLAYRVFDAQYWGVPQRRRRIYLVADFGGERAREILFEREGLRGYFEKGRMPWQIAPADAQGSVGADDREGAVGFDRYNQCLTGEVCETLRTPGGGDNYPTVVQPIGFDAYNQAVTGNVAKSLTSRATDSDHTPIVAYSFDSLASNSMKSTNPYSGCRAVEVATLATHNDQYLFQPMPAADFCTEHSAKARSIGYEEEVAPTLRAGVTPATVYSVENHPADSRVDIDESGKVQTLTSRMGTGGGNVPMVLSPFRKSTRGKFKGDAETWVDGDVANTLNTFDQGESRANELVVMATQQGGAEIRTDNKAPTLTAMAGMSGNNQPVVCMRENTTYSINHQGGNVEQIIENRTGTLTAAMNTSGNNKLSVAYGLDRASFNQGQNAQFDFSVTEEQQPTLVAKGPGDICANYIVRRLTPTECARLQGFADRWGDIEEKESFTDEELRFWQEVRDTYDVVIKGKDPKDLKTYNEKQMLTWYNRLHNDSSEYKMWGNGIARPTALYCMQGIAEVLKRVKRSAWLDELLGD